MIRRLALLLALLLPSGAAAESLRVDLSKTGIEDGWRRDRVTIALNDITPHRVFTLDAPRRLVIDLRDVAPSADLARALSGTGPFGEAEALSIADDWARVVLPINAPLAVRTAGMRSDAAGAILRIVLAPTDAETFAATAGVPPGVAWQSGLVGRTDESDPRPVVVLDAGHGGHDPGAEREGVRESTIMLALAREVAAALDQPGDPRVVLTRDANSFLTIPDRRSRARAQGADLLISLHADALAEAQASGVTVYTLTEDRGEAATRAMIARHDSADLIEGADLSGQGDAVTKLLMRMARERSGPASEAFASLLLRELRATGVPLNSRPRRSAQLAILSSADVPAVLLETGFLSDAADRARLATPEGRSGIVRAIASALRHWAAEEISK